MREACPLITAPLASPAASTDGGTLACTGMDDTAQAEHRIRIRPRYGWHLPYAATDWQWVGVEEE